MTVTLPIYPQQSSWLILFEFNDAPLCAVSSLNSAKGIGKSMVRETGVRWEQQMSPEIQKVAERTSVSFIQTIQRNQATISKIGENLGVVERYQIPQIPGNPLAMEQTQVPRWCSDQDHCQRMFATTARKTNDR